MNPIIENDPMIESTRRSFEELSRTFINKEFYIEDQENISQSENSNEDYKNMSQSENSIEDQEITSRTEDLAVLSLKRIEILFRNMIFNCKMKMMMIMRMKN